MSEPQVVSCPGCGKRYSVPAGAAPGQFQCQDCSAVVVYGPRAAAAQDRPKGSARTHAKAEMARRKMARSRRDEEEEDDRPGRGSRSGRKQQNSSVYLMGIGGFAIMAGGAAYLFSQTQPKETPKPPPSVPAPVPVASLPEPEEPARNSPAPPRPAPSSDPAREPPKPAGGLTSTLRGGLKDSADDFKPAANLPTGSHYGKSQASLLLLLRDKRSEAWVDPGHLPDTPSDLASKIDADVAKMADVNGGSDFLKAQDRLVKIGRPAIPKVVGLLSRLDFSKYSTMLEARDACALGDAIDNVLRGITGYEQIPQLQYSPMDGKLSAYVDSLDAWCLWWFTSGYKRETFYRKSGAAEEEKL